MSEFEKSATSSTSTVVADEDVNITITTTSPPAPVPAPAPETSDDIGAKKHFEQRFPEPDIKFVNGPGINYDTPFYNPFGRQVSDNYAGPADESCFDDGEDVDHENVSIASDETFVDFDDDESDDETPILRSDQIIINGAIGHDDEITDFGPDSFTVDE